MYLLRKEFRDGLFQNKEPKTRARRVDPDPGLEIFILSGPKIFNKSGPGSGQGSKNLGPGPDLFSIFGPGPD